MKINRKGQGMLSICQCHRYCRCRFGGCCCHLVLVHARPINGPFTHTENSKSSKENNIGTERIQSNNQNKTLNCDGASSERNHNGIKRKQSNLIVENYLVTSWNVIYLIMYYFLYNAHQQKISDYQYPSNTVLYSITSSNYCRYYKTKCLRIWCLYLLSISIFFFSDNVCCDVNYRNINNDDDNNNQVSLIVQNAISNTTFDTWTIATTTNFTNLTKISNFTQGQTNISYPSSFLSLSNLSSIYSIKTTGTTPMYFNLSKEYIIWNANSNNEQHPIIALKRRNLPSIGHHHHYHIHAGSSDLLMLSDEPQKKTIFTDDNSQDIMIVEDVQSVEDFSQNNLPKNSKLFHQNKANQFLVNNADKEEYDEEITKAELSGQNFDSHQQSKNSQPSSFFSDNVDYIMHSPRTVQTKYGSIQGIVITFVRYNEDNSKSNQEYNSNNFSTSAPIITLAPVEAFLGVPYATPPSGNIRFMPPVAPIHWRGVRQANRLGPVCPQPLPVLNKSEANKNENKRQFDHLRRLLPFLQNQSEDCLHLNIYVPFEQYYQHRLFQRQRQQQTAKKKSPSPSSTYGKFEFCFTQASVLN